MTPPPIRVASRAAAAAREPEIAPPRRSGAARRSGLGRTLARGALLTALFAAITWAMFFQLGRAQGRPTPAELDDVALIASPDGPLVIWILSWSAHALRHQPFDLFDANMFHPTDDSLAYTESMAPLAPLWTLLRGAAGDPILALNLLLLVVTVLNMCGGYVLARWLTGRVDAGILAAVLFAYNGYASAHRMHFQLQVMFLVPIALLLLFRWLEERRRRDAVLLGFVWAALSVTVVYYGMIFSLMAAVVLAGYLVARRLRPGPRFVSGLATVVMVVAVLVAPFAAAYLGMRGTPELAVSQGYDLAPIDLVTPSVGSRVHRWLEAIGPPRSEEHRHFPGFLAIVLGAFGLWSALSAPHPEGSGGRWLASRPRRLDVVLLAAAGTVCLVLAFGAEARGAPLPYSLLHAHVPGFDRLRVASRIAFGTIVAGTVLAAVGYARLTAPLWRPGDGGRRRATRLAAVLAATVAISLVALENASQTRLFPRPITDAEAEVNHALAAAPPGAVLELPIATGVGPEPARMEAERFLLSTIDWKPRVNGYSGGYPPEYFPRAVELAQFPAAAALELICELDVRYVVLRAAEPAGGPGFTPEHAADVVARLPRQARWERHGQDYIVDLGDERSGGGSGVCGTLDARREGER